MSTRPIALSPGERVLNRAQQRQLATGAAFVTAIQWGANLQHPQYGTDETLSARRELVGRLLQGRRQWYECIDGTAYGPETVLADLTAFQAVAHGILLRHVIDQSEEWTAILENAMASATKRIVVVTFTPDADRTHVAKIKSGWPVMHFNPCDLRAAMGRWLVTDRQVRTSHQERIYYLERPCGS